MRNKIILLSFLLFIVAATKSQSVTLEPIGKHYKTLASLNAAPVGKRSYLDTISFPWSEYSRSAITNSLLRTVYLSEEEEGKLPTLISYPANSSEQTRGELDYLLQLQTTRTPDQIKRAEYIAQIGSAPSIINPSDSDYTANRNQLFYIAQNVGEWYNPENFPATARLFMNTIQDIRATEFRLKRFLRERDHIILNLNCNHWQG